MKILAAAVAVCVLAGIGRAQDAGADHWDARLTAATGEVVVHPAGGGDEVAGEADMPLEEGDRVTTGADSTAEISLDGQSLISLRENSDFTLENTDKKASVFSLSLGSLLAKIEKLGTRSLSVHSPTSVAAVRGTEFGVDVEGDSSHVGVFDEGRVEVSGAAGGTQVLTPNQETSVARGQRPTQAAPLKRFAARRALMRAHVRRLAFVRRHWKAMPPAQRREARARALERQRQRRQNRMRRMRQGQTPENRQRRRGRMNQPRRRRKPNRKDNP